MLNSRAALGARTAGSVRTAARLVWTLLAVAFAGCGGLEPVAPYTTPITDPAQLPTHLGLNARALTLSTAPAYNTWRLTATPLSADGGAISTTAVPAFNSTDVSVVQVTVDGQLTAVQSGVAQIAVELIMPGNLRLVDTVVVNVTTLDAPPTLASVSIAPIPPDSAIVPILPEGGAGFEINAVFLADPVRITPRALDAMGNPIDGIIFEYESLNPAILTIRLSDDRQTGTIQPIRPGRASVVARTTAYGVTMVDTTVFNVTMPFFSYVKVQSTEDRPAFFRPDEIHIRTNGVIYWTNTLDREVDITFDDPTNVVEAPARVCEGIDSVVARQELDTRDYCVPGNFTLLANPPDSNGYRTLTVRRFSAPGTYNYRSAIGTGRIVVSNAGLEP